jgi:hypothetical protein
MRLIPLSEEAKKEIEFTRNLRKEEYVIHHNYSNYDTTYEACVNVYYRNQYDTYYANYSSMVFGGLIILTIIAMIIFLKKISNGKEN